MKQSTEEKIVRIVPWIMAILAVVIGVLLLYLVAHPEKASAVKRTIKQAEMFVFTAEPIIHASETFPDMDIDEQFLEINEYSRPGIETGKIEKIVIHYTANPGTDAQANRDYFYNLKDTEITYASSHFVIGLDGHIIQCMPLNELAYASNEMNSKSISIECCHPNETGEFSTITYNRCVELVAQLCVYYRLDPREDVIRHYDVTGKNCPKFYVENQDEWDMFVGFVEDRVKVLKTNK